METVKNNLRCSVVMLDASKASEITLIIMVGDGSLAYNSQKLNSSFDKFNVNKHLYLISNREIKEGDWLYSNITNSFCQRINMADGYNKNVFKRIEVTTDTSLNLPLIPQSFIEKYVSVQGNIKEVMIEIVDNRNEEWFGDNETGQPFWNSKIEIKTRKDNTVIIHPIKDNWNREEVKAIAKTAWDIREAGALAFDDFEDWFNQSNLM